MPLIQGKSPESFSKNVGKEMEAGKPRGQSLAIAYAVKRRMAQKKMSKGGMADEKYINRPYPKDSMMMADGGMATKPVDYNETTNMRKNQIANAFNKRMAAGGMVENEDLDPMNEPEHGAENEMYKEHRFGKMAQEHEEIDEPREPIQHYMASEEDMPHGMLGNIAQSIMKKRMMAAGGMVEYPGKDEVTGQSHMGMSDRAIHNPGTDNMTYINSHPDDDFLSDEEQTPFFHFNDRDEFEPSEKRKRMLGDIMRGLHRSHMGA